MKGEREHLFLACFGVDSATTPCFESALWIGLCDSTLIHNCAFNRFSKY